MYERHWWRLLQFRPTQVRYWDVYATFEASADALRQSRETTAGDVLELLPLLVVCAASQLLMAVFRTEWNGGRIVPPDTGHDAEDDRRPLYIIRWK